MRLVRVIVIASVAVAAVAGALALSGCAGTEPPPPSQQLQQVDNSIDGIAAHPCVPASQAGFATTLSHAAAPSRYEQRDCPNLPRELWVVDFTPSDARLYNIYAQGNPRAFHGRLYVWGFAPPEFDGRSWTAGSWEPLAVADHGASTYDIVSASVPTDRYTYLRIAIGVWSEEGGWPEQPISLYAAPL